MEADHHLSLQLVAAILISSAVGIRSYLKKSLNLSGALAGFLVMSIHFGAGFRYGALLMVFFLSSSKLTNIGKEKKRLVDADFKEGGQRNWVQVLSNGGIASVLAVVLWVTTGAEDGCLDSVTSPLKTFLIGGIIGHYSCSNGDTWSSEVGILSRSQPRLITTLKPVERGVNGGVTNLGVMAAAGAGAVIGVTFVVLGLFTVKCPHDVALRQALVIPVGVLAGVFGSLTDSLLGATLQFSGFCAVRKKVVSKPGGTVKRISGLDFMDNNGVNVVSIFITTLFTATLCLYLF